MSYAEKLAALLRPLGVYRLEESSYSGAELAALGAAMDAVQAQLDGILEAASPLTASGDALAQAEALFPLCSAGQTLQARREALAGFWRVTQASFTKQALCACLCACGCGCQVEETGTPGEVEVTFPGTRGEPEGLAQMQEIIELILPCHLDIRYRFFWCTWAETEEAGLLWGDLEEGSWGDWERFAPEAE